jgi:hypothetical protein
VSLAVFGEQVVSRLLVRVLAFLISLGQRALKLAKNQDNSHQ